MSGRLEPVFLVGSALLAAAVLAGMTVEVIRRLRWIETGRHLAWGVATQGEAWLLAWLADNGYQESHIYPGRFLHEDGKRYCQYTATYSDDDFGDSVTVVFYDDRDKVAYTFTCKALD